MSQLNKNTHEVRPQIGDTGDWTHPLCLRHLLCNIAVQNKMQVWGVAGSLNA
jgi:hypothetical protein